MSKVVQRRLRRCKVDQDISLLDDRRIIFLIKTEHGFESALFILHGHLQDHEAHSPLRTGDNELNGHAFWISTGSPGWPLKVFSCFRSPSRLMEAAARLRISPVRASRS